MKKVLAVLGVASTIALAAAPPAHAGSLADSALALGAFAVFNQLVTGQTVFQRAYNHLLSRRGMTASPESRVSAIFPTLGTHVLVASPSCRRFTNLSIGTTCARALASPASGRVWPGLSSRRQVA